MRVGVDIVVNAILRHVKGFINRLIFVFRSQFYDEHYLALTEDELEQVLREWRERYLPRLHYRPDIFDCDDFAECFSAFAKMTLGKNGVGEAYGKLCYGDACGGHAWNIAIVERGENDVEAICIEPQIAERVPCTGLSEDSLLYELEWVTM